MGSNITATLIYETEAPIRVNCASAAAFEKGDCVTLTGATLNMFVAITSSNADIMGGIVAEEKIANVGASVAVYRKGIFRVEVGAGGATVGLTSSIIAKNNFTNGAATDHENGITWGRFLESGADTDFVAMELFS